MVGMLYRPGYYAVDEDEKQRLESVAKLSVAKNRDGETGEARLVWTAPLMRFTDAGPEQQEFADYTPKSQPAKRKI
jgi:replicative DNA helicase